MRKVNDIIKTTKNRFLNMYELDMVDENGKHGKYFVASRAEKIEDLKIVTRKNKADGVIIYSVYRDETGVEKLVLIRQYRCPIDDYIYEFPAGLVDAGEDFKVAGKRELKEELDLDVKVCGLYACHTFEYPDFIITLSVYECEQCSDFVLKEHESYAWIAPADLKEEEWAPADAYILGSLKRLFGE